MNSVEAVHEILEAVRGMIFSKTCTKKYVNDSNAFTRSRKMPLPKLIIFLMKRSLKSYDLRLNDFCEKFDIDQESIPTKQAVSKARGKLDWEIFKYFCSVSSRMFLREEVEKRNWNGYQIYAVDGSDCEVPVTDETIVYFGNMSSKKAKRNAGATSSTLTDVMNGIVIDARIEPYKTSETELAIEHCEAAKPYLNLKKSIMIYDRGYISYKLFGYMFDNNIKFLVRIKGQNTRMRTPDREDGEVYAKCGNKMRTLRTIEVELEDETKEYLVTNLGKDEVKLKEFRELYFIRWGVESKYQELKNRLKIEEFSGTKPNNIRQDYYISIFISNIAGMIKNKVDKDIEKEGERDKKWLYQANRSYITGCVNNLLELVMYNKGDIQQELLKLISKSRKKRSLVRPNRKNERGKVLSRRKHHHNYKPCI